MSKERKTPAVLGLDMGGTHTDAVLLRGGTLLASVKVPTNHQDLLVSTREALHALFESGAAFPADVSRATFGTTLAVNAVVQDACAPVGLLIGAGPGLDPGWFGLGGHTALVPGGVDHRGTEVAPPDREAIRRVVSGWREEGLAAFACVAKFSTRNPAHEDAMAEVIREVFSDGPEPVIALGHRLSGRLNFPRRIATAYWNAAVWTLHNRFADAVEASLKDMGIDAPAYLLKADGGAIPLSVSRERPVEALLSGPAASVMGMMALMPSCSEDTLVLDMGGTTTDIALLAAGQPVLSSDDLVVNGRSTLVRALKSVSIGLDSAGDGRPAAQGARAGVRRDGRPHISRLPQCAWTCGRRGCCCVTRGCGIPCRSPRAERRVPLAGGFGLRPFPRRLRRAVVAR
ncbi:MAG: hydantoinase/oxoprolinase N-terminal domain-containing protein [Bilophila wadsworthia]